MPGLRVTWQREAAFRLCKFQRLQLFMKTILSKKYCGYFLCSVPCCALPGDPSAEDSKSSEANVGYEIYMLDWNIRFVLQIYLSKKVSRDGL